MRKLSLALTVMACSMTVSAQISSVPSSWDGQRWTDQYMGKTWNKTWQNGQLVASTDERQAEHWMADLPDNMFVAHHSLNIFSEILFYRLSLYISRLQMYSFGLNIHEISRF